MNSSEQEHMNWLKTLWCSWAHGGGHIKRDSQDRINWQCKKCGRWADPIPLEQEKRMTDRSVETSLLKREWVGLTEEELIKIWKNTPAESEYWFEFAKAIEAKLKEKNL